MASSLSSVEGRSWVLIPPQQNQKSSPNLSHFFVQSFPDAVHLHAAVHDGHEVLQLDPGVEELLVVEGPPVNLAALVGQDVEVAGARQVVETFVGQRLQIGPSVV